MLAADNHASRPARLRRNRHHSGACRYSYVRRVQVIVGTSLGFIYGAHAPETETLTATAWAETAKPKLPSQSLRQQPTPKVRLAAEIGDR